MKRKRRPTVNKYILQAEYMRITPEERMPLLAEEPSLEALRFAFIHDVILSHVDVFGVPEELQAEGYCYTPYFMLCCLGNTVGVPKNQSTAYHI